MQKSRLFEESSVLKIKDDKFIFGIKMSNNYTNQLHFEIIQKFYTVECFSN